VSSFCLHVVDRCGVVLRVFASQLDLHHSRVVVSICGTRRKEERRTCGVIRHVRGAGTFVMLSCCVRSVVVVVVVVGARRGEKVSSGTLLQGVRGAGTFVMLSCCVRSVVVVVVVVGARRGEKGVRGAGTFVMFVGLARSL
jgi:hypothetical protein